MNYGISIEENNMQISLITCVVEFSASHDCRVYVAEDLHESLLKGMCLGREHKKALIVK